MKKLGDLLLGPLEVNALYRLLAEHITDDDRAAYAYERNEQRKQNERVLSQLMDIARQTAIKDGITSFSGVRQALASWEAFCANESWHSPSDVDEYWTPNETWYEYWEMAYTEQLRVIETGSKGPST